jgi:uncharacterized protein (UPF0332 family)
VTIPPFAHALMRKSERALESARIDLRYGDADGAVNRAYYAMFNAARASLLSAGVSEGDLPRTHNGVIAAFGQHAVKTGRVDPALGRSFNEAEVLRLRADYTGLEIAPRTAEEIVSRAEVFVRTVGLEFGLDGPDTERIVRNELLATENRDLDLRAEQRSESAEVPAPRPSADEIRSKAREDWLKNYYYKGNDANQAGSHTDSKQKDQQKEAGRFQPRRDAGLDRDPE